MMSKYLVLKGKYGFGNRLQALCQALVYCQLTGRQIVVDWRDARYSDSGSNIFPLLFESLGRDTSFLDRVGNSVFPTIWKGMLDKEIDWMKTQFRSNSTARERAHQVMQKFSISPLRLNSNEQVVVMFDYKFNWSCFANHLHVYPLLGQQLVLAIYFTIYSKPILSHDMKLEKESKTSRQRTSSIQRLGYTFGTQTTYADVISL